MSNKSFQIPEFSFLVQKPRISFSQSQRPMQKGKEGVYTVSPFSGPYLVMISRHKNTRGVDHRFISFLHRTTNLLEERFQKLHTALTAKATRSLCRGGR